jgi:copper chaperone
VERPTCRVEGTTCTGCESNVESALGGLEAVRRVEANHETDVLEAVAGET